MWFSSFFRAFDVDVGVGSLDWTVFSQHLGTLAVAAQA